MIDSRASAPLDCTQNNRSVLWRIGQEYAEPLRAPITRETAIGGSSSWDEYELVASRRGPRAALAAATERFPYLLWYTNGKTDRARVRGSMWITRVPCGLSRVVFRRHRHRETFGGKARPLAESAIQGGFKRDPSRLTLETAVTATWREHLANRFVWTEQGEWYGLKPPYAAVLVGRDIASLDRQPELPAGYVRREYGQPSSWKWETGPPLVFLLTILGVARRSRVRISDVARDDRRPDVCPWCANEPSLPARDRSRAGCRADAAGHRVMIVLSCPTSSSDVALFLPCRATVRVREEVTSVMGDSTRVGTPRHTAANGHRPNTTTYRDDMRDRLSRLRLSRQFVRVHCLVSRRPSSLQNL